MRISDWSSDVCSSDLAQVIASRHPLAGAASVARFPGRTIQSGRCAASYPASGSGVSHAAPLPFVPGPITRGIAQNGVSIDAGPDWAWTASAVPACEPAKPNAIAATIGRASCRERVWRYVETLVDAVSLKKNNKYTFGC